MAHVTIWDLGLEEKEEAQNHKGPGQLNAMEVHTNWDELISHASRSYASNPCC